MTHRPAGAPDGARSVFVMQPFTDPYDVYYQKVYAPAITAGGWQPRRADDIFRAGNVVMQIVEAIQDAELIVAELTDANPNVYYELGLAHALVKPCVLLTSRAADIPFDLRNQRHIVYDPLRPDWADDLRADLTLALTETAADPASSTLLPVLLNPSIHDRDTEDVPDFGAALAMLQSSVDSLRGEVSLNLIDEGNLGPLGTARELRAEARRLLGAGSAPETVVSQLRRRGAPTVWARKVVERIQQGSEE